MAPLVSIALASALLTAVCSAYVAHRALGRAKARGSAAEAFLLVLALQIVCALALAGEGSARTLSGKLLWDSVSTVLTMGLPFALVHFAERWFGSERSEGRISRGGWLLLAALPIATSAFVLTDGWHGLARPDARLVDIDGHTTLDYSFSTLEWINIAELYALSAYGATFSLHRAWRRSPAFRAQAAVVALAVAMPALGSIPSIVFDLRLFGQRDLGMVILFGAGSVVVTWALYRQRLFDLSPIPYDAVLDQLPLPLVVLDERGRVADANPAALELFALPPGVAGWSTDQAATRSAEFAQVSAALKASADEVTLGDRVFELHESELRTGSGVEGRVIQLHDVSARRRAEDDVRKARDALELRVTERTQELSRANQALRQEMEERHAAEAAREQLKQRLETSQRLEALGRLAGGVAHDFNNLLTVILGNARLMTMGETSERQRELLAEIESAGHSATALTQQLLAFARRQVVDPKTIDLVKAVDDAHRLIARLLGENITTHTIHHEPRLCARIDPSQLEQILVNLCVNARDAMPEQGVLTIETCRAPAPPGRRPAGFHTGSEEKPSYAIVGVSDSGTGIVPELLDRVFEPFFTTKPAGKGTGLGLATVYGIVEQAGGFVLVDSEPGRGTSFRVYLPEVEDNDTPVAAVMPGVTRRSGTVVLVEDQDAVREVTRRMLDHLGYHVLPFASARQALEALDPPALSSVDLLVSDVIMPDLNGPMFVAEVRKRHPSLPVLFLSGYTEDALTDRAAAMSGIPVLAKPFEVDRLSAALARALEAASDRRA